MRAAKLTAARILPLGQFPGLASASDAASWPDKRRGISNFLTWPFFLAELWAADLLFGSGAKAEETLTDPEKFSQDLRPTDEDAARLPPWQQADTALEPAAPEQHGSLHTPSPLPPGISQGDPVSLPSSASDQPIFGSASAGGGGGGSGFGGFGFHGQNMPEGTTASELIASLEPSEASDLGLELTSVAFEFLPEVEIQPVADISLDLHTLGLELGVESGLLGLDVGFDGEELLNVIDDVTGLNLVGTIESVTSLLDSSFDETVDSPVAVELTSVTSLVDSAADAAGRLLSVGPTNDLSLSDTIALPPTSDELEPDSLFVDGKYTDYNLALQTGTDTGQGETSSTAEAATNNTTDVAAIDLSIDESTGSSVELLIGDNDLLRGL